MGYWLLHLMRFNGRINQAYKGICDNIWTNYDDLTAKSLDLGPKKWMNWCHALYFGVKSRGFHVYLSIYLSIYLFIYLFVYQSVYSVCLSVYLSTRYLSSSSLFHSSFVRAFFLHIVYTRGWFGTCFSHILGIS